MKRHFNLLASVLLVIAMVFALASCDLIDKIIPGKDQPEPEHQHAFVDGSCECGEADPNYVAPHTHNFVEGKCECGETDPNYVKPECTEHAYGAPEVTKEATCTESGSKTLTCTVCGYATELEIAPNGHTEEDIPGKAATCTEAGLSTGSQCTVCGVVTEEQIAINPKGHSFVEGSCTVCGEVDPEYNGPKTYVFDVQTLSAFAAGAKADGETELVADFFTIYYSAKTKVDTTKNKTWPDGYTFAEGLRLNWGGTTAIGETTKNAIEIVVDGTATVKVWWICGGDGREIGIFDENGDLVVASQTEDVFTEGTEGVGAGKNGVYLSELSLDAAGKYYIGTDNTNAVKNGGNIICKVEVTVTPAEEVEVPELKVETTDTYGWFDEYTFTADAEGYYTFTLPAGLGFCSKAQYDKYDAPEVDIYDNAEGATVVVGLEAGEELVFYVGALTKDTWTITWSFEAGEVENGSQGGEDSGVTELVVGSNNVVFADGELSMGKEFSFTVTEEGTYTFRGDLMAAVMDAEGNSMGRGQVYLTPGTYTVALFSMMPMPSNSFVINITFEAPATGEADGSEQFPYIWETIPESVVLDYAVVSGKVYYIFTATADGTITFTWPVSGDSWYDIFELDANGNNTSNSASGFMKDSHSFVVEAGKSYRVSLGSWAEAGSHTIAISFSACNHVWSEATCTAPSTCANCGATTGDKAEHTSTVAEPTCANPDVCGVCGVELSYVDHAWDDGVVITPADCATETHGTKLLTCTVCGATQEETIWGYHIMDETYNYPTCTVDGSYHGVCTVCGYEESRVIEAQGHYNYMLSCGETGECFECGETFTLEHDFSWSPATCTEPAYCGNCWQYIGEALGHDYDHITHDATCTAGGYTEHICALCDYTYTDSETEALGHADANGDFKCDACSTKMLPADGEALTIPQAIAIAKLAGSSYTTQKYYITGIVTNVYNTTYGNLYLKDADGNQICIYGLYTWGNGTSNGTRYDKMEYKPVEGDELTVYTVLGTYNSTAQGKDAWVDEVVAHEHDYTETVTAPTCVADGFTTHTCSICKDSYTDSEVAALGHTTENGTCERCNLTIGGDTPVIGEIVTFNFGANGSAAHVDGNDYGASKTFTEGGYSLKLTGMSKVFGPAYDAKGNSCLKLGTSKVIGKFSFTVDEDVTSVVIYVAGYKTATSTNVKVNGTSYNVKTTSNNGEYTAIEIDTTTTKTITFESVTYRCMIDKIVYNGVVA